MVCWKDLTDSSILWNHNDRTRKIRLVCWALIHSPLKYFIQQDTGVDGNKKIYGRKGHVITDTLGLIWGVVVHAANLADGTMAQRVVDPLLGYLDPMKKILANEAYEKVFREWVTNNLLSVELEITTNPPQT